MKASCPVCGRPAQAGDGRTRDVQCPACGHFRITASAAATLDKSCAVRLSAWLRSHHEHGVTPPELDTRNLPRIVDALPRHGPAARQLMLLQALERRSPHAGAEPTLREDVDAAVCGAANAVEFRYLMGELSRRGLVDEVYWSARGEMSARITTAGWEQLEAARGTPGLSTQGFVAMSYGEALDAAYDEGLAPAIRDAGYDPYRMDRRPHNERIDAKIVAEIVQSRFVVADVTEQRAGVYFEAGYAIGLGKPVLWSVRADDLANVHFDTRQYSHVVWRTPSDLREQLFYLVCAVLGRRRAAQAAAPAP